MRPSPLPDSQGDHALHHTDAETDQRQGHEDHDERIVADEGDDVTGPRDSVRDDSTDIGQDRGDRGCVFHFDIPHLLNIYELLQKAT